MTQPIHQFTYWGYPAKVYTGQGQADYLAGLKTIFVEWRKGRGSKFIAYIRYAPEMEADMDDYLLPQIKEHFTFSLLQRYAKLFNSIRNLKGDRRRGRRSKHKHRFSH